LQLLQRKLTAAVAIADPIHHGHAATPEHGPHWIALTSVAGATQRCGPGSAAIIPPHTPHAVLAVKAGRAIVVDYPLREGF
jgi:hypothetical protein